MSNRNRTNAKLEFIRATTRNGDVKVHCATITYSPNGLWDEETEPQSKHVFLKVGYTTEEYNAFLNQLDFDYDTGYGGQELYGTVWMLDDTWLTRGEYDGSEWWDFNSLPEIPKELAQ
jgi:hypothetical protein